MFRGCCSECVPRHVPSTREQARRGMDWGPPHRPLMNSHPDVILEQPPPKEVSNLCDLNRPASFYQASGALVGHQYVVLPMLPGYLLTSSAICAARQRHMAGAVTPMFAKMCRSASRNACCRGTNPPDVVRCHLRAPLTWAYVAPACTRSVPGVDPLLVLLTASLFSPLSALRCSQTKWSGCSCVYAGGRSL
jgi:hypothetical protein